MTAPESGRNHRPAGPAIHLLWPPVRPIPEDPALPRSPDGIRRSVRAAGWGQSAKAGLILAAVIFAALLPAALSPVPWTQTAAFIAALALVPHLAGFTAFREARRLAKPFLARAAECGPPPPEEAEAGFEFIRVAAWRRMHLVHGPFIALSAAGILSTLANGASSETWEAVAPLLGGVAVWSTFRFNFEVERSVLAGLESAPEPWVRALIEDLLDSAASAFRRWFATIILTGVATRLLGFAVDFDALAETRALDVWITLVFITDIMTRRVLLENEHALALAGWRATLARRRRETAGPSPRRDTG